METESAKRARTAPIAQKTAVVLEARLVTKSNAAHLTAGARNAEIMVVGTIADRVRKGFPVQTTSVWTGAKTNAAREGKDVTVLGSKSADNMMKTCAWIGAR